MNVTDTTSYRPWQIKLFTATWLSYAGYYFCRKAFYVVKSSIAATFGLSAIHLAQLGTAFLIFYMVGQFSSAYFGRRLGPKRLLLVGMALSLFCNMAFGIANGFWTFLLFLSLNGLAQGTGWPGCIGSLAFWFKRKQRGSILGVWSTCYQLGSVLATSFAAYLLGYAGWRWSFFGCSLVLLAVWFIVLLLHPDKPENVGLPPLEPESEDEPDSAPTTGLGWNRQIIVTIILMGLIYFCIKFLRYALWSWVPFFLNQNYHISGDRAGYLSTVFDLAGFVGVLVAGVLSDKLFKGKRSTITLIMLVFMTASFGLMYFLGTQSVLYFAISMGCAGFMLYGPDSLISGVGAIDATSKRGALAAAGIINGTGSIGPIFQEEVIGWMFEHYHHNLNPIFFMLLSVAIVGTVLTALLWLRSKAGKSRL